MKYNPAVRKNILLQNDPYTNQENVAFTEALAAVEQLDDNTNDELAQALVHLCVHLFMIILLVQTKYVML